mmetsp:Transcript_11221/g.29351  ORF Transcript_11221/g.29351 Transcript_11221/m.29351 type:complete len:111 (+) Transcript_11221:536-868(+)
MRCLLPGAASALISTVCRVLLGRIRRSTSGVGREGKADADLRGRLREEGYDSIMGDLEGAPTRTYREFCIPHSDQAFPEFVIIYERLYGEAGSSYSTSPPKRTGGVMSMR